MPVNKTAEQIVDGLITKAIKTWNMVEDGDRILIAASGGKDSSVMARDLILKQKQGRLPAKLGALHIHSDFSPAMSDAMHQKYKDWGLEPEALYVPIEGRLKEGRKMNCYWCSMQRRTELIRYAIDKGYNCIALGHHLDDVLETLFMNMMHKAVLSTMPPKMQYIKYPLKIIRPLYLVEEKQIIKLASLLGLDSMTCTCNYNDNSARDEAGTRIELLTQGSSDAKRAILKSLSNIKPDYLP